MPQNSPKINLESLLKLKRAERPDPAIWDQFQDEFRQRQLQTLITPKPVWSHLPRFLLARSRLLAPLLGLAVVLFVFLLNFRDNPPLQDEWVETVALAQPVAEPVVEPLVMERAIPPQTRTRQEPAFIPAISSTPDSFVVDVIPAELPEAPTYTQEFPTPTIRSNSESLATFVSYTLSRETPIYASARLSQTIGF